MAKNLARRVIPSFIWNRLRSMKAQLLVDFRRPLEYVGYTVARRDDYYSPLSPVSRLKSNAKRWNRPSTLKGVEYDLKQMKKDFSDLLSRYLGEFSLIPSYKTLQSAGFGPGYTAVDALTLYMMVRHFRPKRYIEIGSGLSTYYCSLAAEKNAGEGHPVEITCIEPYPFEKLRSIADIQLISTEVQNIELSVFRQLQENDILFIDSSHVLRIDGDVPFLYLEVLPHLNPGVVTHIHDVPFPYNIPFPPQRWIFGEDWPMLWNEAMVLQAFLCFNEKFKIMMSTPLIRHFDESFLQQNIPFYETLSQNTNAFSSIWLKRFS